MHTHKGFRDGSTITIIIFQAGKVARWLRALVASAEDAGLGLNPHGFGSLNPHGGSAIHNSSSRSSELIPWFLCAIVVEAVHRLIHAGKAVIVQNK